MDSDQSFHMYKIWKSSHWSSQPTSKLYCFINVLLYKLCFLFSFITVPLLLARVGSLLCMDKSQYITNKTCVSSIIHSARPTVLPVAIIVFCCIVLLDLNSGDRRMYGRMYGLMNGRTTCAKKLSLPAVTVGWPSGSTRQVVFVLGSNTNITLLTFSYMWGHGSVLCSWIRKKMMDTEMKAIYLSWCHKVLKKSNVEFLDCTRKLYFKMLTEDSSIFLWFARSHPDLFSRQTDGRTPFKTNDHLFYKVLVGQ